MTSNPIVRFVSPEGHYTADACVVWCYDDRFYKLLKAFGKQEGFNHIDLIKVAGGAKSLADGAAAGREFLLDQIKVSVRLHGARRVILMLHRDCGAYGGTSSFPSPDVEEAYYVNQLAVARAFVKSEVPELTAVDTYYADFNGLYAVD